MHTRKNMSEEGPACGWKTLGIGVLLLIAIVAMILCVIFLPLDDLCLAIDAIFIVLIIAGYFILRRGKSEGRAG